MGNCFSVINLTNKYKKEQPNNDELEKLKSEWLKTLAINTK